MSDSARARRLLCHAAWGTCILRGNEAGLATLNALFRKVGMPP